MRILSFFVSFKSEQVILEKSTLNNVFILMIKNDEIDTYGFHCVILNYICIFVVNLSILNKNFNLSRL